MADRRPSVRDGGWNVEPDDDETAIRDRALAAIHAGLDGVELEHAWSHGREMGLPEALAFARDTPAPRTAEAVSDED